jgi:DNA-binding response OmpR family regulator
MDLNERLLIVDDDPDIRDIVRTWAARNGCEVEAVSGWREMSGVIRTFAPTTILLDLMMPDVDGIETLHHLAESGCRAKILLMSGADAPLLEVAGVLEKPLNLHTLQDLVGGRERS